MAASIAHQIRIAISHLNPQQVRDMVEEPVNIGIVAVSGGVSDAIVDFLVPSNISHRRRNELTSLLHIVGEPGPPIEFDMEIYEEGLPHPLGAFVFYDREPERMVQEILEARKDLALPLARRFPVFRKPAIDNVIQSVSWENALFACLSALPNVLPSFIQLPWAAGEFASDTAFLTMNQVRMNFLIAAASDREVGYKEQRAEIASIVAGAFGWRALARQITGKIPFGAGLIPKAAVAYAGTFTVGQGLERFFRIGYRLTRAERREVYEDALEQGKRLVASFLENTKLGDVPRDYQPGHTES